MKLEVRVIGSLSSMHKAQFFNGTNLSCRQNGKIINLQIREISFISDSKNFRTQGTVPSYLVLVIG